MVRSVLVGILLVAIGAAAASIFISWRPPTEAVRDEQRAASAARPPAASAPWARAGGDRSPADVGRRIERLEATLAAEVAERQRLEEKLEAVAAHLASLGGSAPTLTPLVTANPSSAAAGEPAAGEEDAVAVDSSTSAVERALAAAGVDAVTAADIKRRRDELTMMEMYLRDRATREQWLDSPQFAAEMAAIDAQRTSIRDEVGDDAYDRYLFALGETNRVRIDDVLLQSPAAQAGLQTGDLILRYGPTRIFAPAELVAETRAGASGETVRLEVVRNGERFELEVPRGPLGLMIAATQDSPDAS